MLLARRPNRARSKTHFANLGCHQSLRTRFSGGHGRREDPPAFHNRNYEMKLQKKKKAWSHNVLPGSLALLCILLRGSFPEKRVAVRQSYSNRQQNTAREDDLLATLAPACHLQMVVWMQCMTHATWGAAIMADEQRTPGTRWLLPLHLHPAKNGPRTVDSEVLVPGHSMLPDSYHTPQQPGLNTNSHELGFNTIFIVA